LRYLIEKTETTVSTEIDAVNQGISGALKLEDPIDKQRETVNFSTDQLYAQQQGRGINKTFGKLIKELA